MTWENLQGKESSISYSADSEMPFLNICEKLSFFKQNEKSMIYYGKLSL